jgi:hypothetical protein
MIARYLWVLLLVAMAPLWHANDVVKLEVNSAAK